MKSTFQKDAKIGRLRCDDYTTINGILYVGTSGLHLTGCIRKARHKVNPTSQIHKDGEIRYMEKDSCRLDKDESAKISVDSTTVAAIAIVISI